MARNVHGFLGVGGWKPRLPMVPAHVNGYCSLQSARFAHFARASDSDASGRSGQKRETCGLATIVSLAESSGLFFDGGVGRPEEMGRASLDQDPGALSGPIGC
jgi:hypothetical protein